MVLLDEIEKAHRDVLIVLLQVMEDGVLTDGKGRSIDFKNVILVMTSNVGSSKILELVGQQRLERARSGVGGERRKKKKRRTEDEYVNGDGLNGDSEALDAFPNGSSSPMNAAEEYSALSEVVQDELQKEMRPELLNRIDEIIVFSPLDDANLRDIAHAIVNASVERAHKEKAIDLSVSESLIDSILSDGAANAAEFGARPMRRAARRLFEDGVSEAIVWGFLKEGDWAIVDVGPDVHKVAIVREDGETLVVDVDDGSGGIGMAASARASNTIGRDQLQPDML